MFIKLLPYLAIIIGLVIIVVTYRFIYDRYLLQVINKKNQKVRLPEFRKFTMVTTTVAIVSMLYIGYVQRNVKPSIASYHFTDISSGTNHFVGVTKNNEIFTWGLNNFGQLGDGTTKRNYQPINITKQFDFNEEETIKKLIVHGHSNYLLTSNNRLFVWGYNFSGQLPDKTDNHQLTPVDITTNFTLDNQEIIIDLNYNSLVTSKGRVFVWERNRFNYRYESLKEITEFFVLNEGEKVIKITTMDELSYALTSEGRVFRSFHYTDNREAIGPDPLSIEITDVFALDDYEIIKDIIQGEEHSIAITSNNRIFSWGLNNHGQLGDGTTNDRNNPVNITNNFNLKDNETIIDIKLGRGHNIVKTSTGRIFAWGYNSVNQIMISERFSSKPIDITDKFMLTKGETILSFNVKGDFNIAFTSKGRIITWGYNWLGTDNLLID